MAEAHRLDGRWSVKVCGACMHTPAYCRCEPAAGMPEVLRQARRAFPELFIKGPAYGKDALLELAEALDEAGNDFWAAVLKANLPIALNAAHEAGYEEGYDAAVDSVSEWLVRPKP